MVTRFKKLSAVAELQDENKAKTSATNTAQNNKHNIRDWSFQ